MIKIKIKIKTLITQLQRVYTKTIKPLYLLACIVLLNACATTTADHSTPPLPKNNHAAWQHYQQQLVTKTHWQLQGIIAVRYAKQAQQANLNWSQQGLDCYQVNLSGPLGIGEIQLTHQQGQYRFTDSHGQTTEANSAQLLMQSLLGWSLPVNGLYYWIRGLASPDMPYQKTLDEYGRLITLSQSGWNISYQRYQWQNGLPLPTLIRLKNQQLWLKIAISDWQQLT
ncbi:Outer-membrane lipoprotein LolB precursor [Piscirickettsia salmonis]|uniref:lipoprotein insertase outer membrane protein LolB n=1 Tax=Piscirickettsia salmonis TaxID=1238 RepID=UPI001E4F02D8|nr:lipoprotein insertase outer membrane protein LolB [Piscirickettsia salmonis]QGP53710.1 Outer-membrane lipoprotein LolB precursor [Piscirickettsia salmonis]QGP60383.1 Outer-membrane lipoprotein LolB precursor [Piscirickettsia salmonis]QGP63284.1 Outer-membrane lipoprotein LolB precursor [Piscirickettsia salmonis]